VDAGSIPTPASKKRQGTAVWIAAGTGRRLELREKREADWPLKFAFALALSFVAIILLAWGVMPIRRAQQPDHRTGVNQDTSHGSRSASDRSIARPRAPARARA